MKGKIKYILFASLLSLASLTGCGGSGGEKDGDGDNQGGDKSGIDGSAAEAKNKLKQLGKTSGFEIGLKAVGEDDDGEVSIDSMTVGFKVDTIWVTDAMAIKSVDAGIEMYTPSETTAGQFDYVATSSEFTFDYYADSFTDMFYIAYQFDSYLEKSGATTFLGRAATKYVFTGSYATAFANVEIIIDNETGITLKYAAAGRDLDGNSSEGSIEVTSFRVGNDVRVPVLNKNGGPGPGPVVPPDGEDQYPTAGRYLLDESQSQNIGIYVNGRLEIEEDGTGKYYLYDGNQGETFYYTGTFVLDGSDIVMTLVMQVFIDANGRGRDSVVEGTLTFEFIGNASWALQYADAYLVYVYDQGQITPPDPGEDVSKYLIDATAYASIVTGEAYLSEDFSCKFNKGYKEYTSTILNETLENDHGNFFDSGVYQLNPGELMFAKIYAKINNQPGYYDVYERNNQDFSWTKTANPVPLNIEILGEWSGLYLLSFVPFDKLTAPTNTTNPYYYCASYSYSNQETGISVNLTNVKMYFENGKLVRFTYTSDNYKHYDVMITDFGTTTVEIPETTQPEQEEKCDALLSLESGSTFVYKTVDMGGYSGSALDEAIADSQKTTYKFFADGTCEVVYVNEGTTVVTLGTFTLMKKPSENIGTATLKMTEQYINDVKAEDFYTGTAQFSYYVKEGQLHLVQNGYNSAGTTISVHIIFERNNVVPEHYVIPTEQQSNWPAEEINKKLQQLGFTVSIPSVIEDEYLSKVDVEIVGKTLVITPHFTDSKVTLSYSDYVDNEDGSLVKAGFSYKTIDFVSYAYTFVSKDQNYEVVVSIDHSDLTKDYFTIVISERVVSDYPEEEINIFVAALDEHIVMPRFEVEGSEAECLNKDDDSYVLMVTYPETYSASDIRSEFARLLTENGFHQFFSGGNLFLTETGSVMVVMSNGDNGRINISIASGAALAEKLTYPAETISDSLPEYLNDYIPNLTLKNAAMYSYEDYTIQIVPENGVSLDTVIRELMNKFYEIDYNVKDGALVSKDEELSVTFAKDDEGIIITISVIAEEPTEVSYNLLDETSWDINQYDPDFYAWVWGGSYGVGKWVKVDVEEDEGVYTYTLNVDSSARGCIIVRVDSDNRVDWDNAGNEVFDLDIVWNKTADIMLLREGGNISWIFRD